jgi:hypothetical protein
VVELRQTDIQMTVAPVHKANPSEARAHLVAALARDLNVSVDEVGGVFREQFEQLSSQARIHQFVVTLAVRNTRGALLKRHGRTKPRN